MFKKRDLPKEDRERREQYIMEGDNKIVIFLDIVLTFLAWIVTIFCFRDLLFFILNVDTEYWASRFPVGGNFIFLPPSSPEILLMPPLKVLINLGIFVVVIIIVDFIWITYNKLAFGGLDRRKHPQPWSEQKIADLYGITVEQYQVYQHGKNISITFTEDHKVSNVNADGANTPTVVKEEHSRVEGIFRRGEIYMSMWKHLLDEDSDGRV